MDGYFGDRKQRRPSIGYGGYFSADPPMAQSDLTPEQRESLLEQITGRSMQATGGLLDLLSVPVGYARGFLVGTPGETATADEFLDYYNALPDESALGGWGRPAARFLAEAIPDPLNLIGVGGVNKAGQAARAAGLLDDATRVMSKNLVRSGNLNSSYAKSALRDWGSQFGKKAADLTDADLVARPLAGTRQSRRNVTLGELIAQQADPAAATRKVENALSAMPGQPQLRDLAGQTLANDIGFTLPFSDYTRIGFNIPGGEAYARGMDAAMQGLRWSAPGRYSHALFNQDVSGAYRGADQVESLRVNAADRLAEQVARRKVSEALQPIAHLLSNPSVAQSMRRVLNGLPTQADATLLAANPALQKFADDWRILSADILQRRGAVGLPSKGLDDPWTGAYFPRHADSRNFADIDAAENLLGGTRAFSRKTGDMAARNLTAPGGEDIINRLSLDPQVAGAGRLAADDEAAARYIKAQMDAEAASLRAAGTLPASAPKAYSMKDARRLAQVLYLRNPEAIANKVPLFGNHFADDFSRYVVGNERAIAVNKTLMDSIAQSAQPMRARNVPGGGYQPVRTAMRKLSMYPTADAELLAKLQQRFPSLKGINAASVSRDTVRRITRMADYYNSPQAQSRLMEIFDGLTRMWKSSILAWPAKFSRDYYGSAFINLVEVGDPGAVLQGYSGAKALMQGNLDQLDGILESIPAYGPGLTKAQRLSKFQADLAAGGALDSTRAMDYGDFLRDAGSGRAVLDEMVPGINKETTLGWQFWDSAKLRAPVSPDNAAYSELANATNWFGKDAQGNLNFFKMGAFSGHNDVKNPLMRWGARLGTTTDKINRLSGIIGLMATGVDPMEAIRRMKVAHIDYGSLTKFERETMRRMVPFWSFNSRIGRWVAEKLWENPGGRFTQLGLRAPDAFLQTDDEGYVPESIRSSYGTPTSWANPVSALMGQEQAPNVTPWLTDIDLPGIDALNLVKPQVTSSGMLDPMATIWATTQNAVGGLAHPVAKAAFESVTGTDSFTKRPIKEMRTAAGQIAESVLGIPENSMYGQYIKTAKPWLDLVPFMPRSMQIANRLMDDEKVPNPGDRAYQMAVNAFTGVKFQNVDDEARRVDARKKIGDILMDDPLVRSFTQPFVPEEAKPFVSPETLMMMSLDRQLSRELKAARDKRAGRVTPKKRKNTDETSYFS